MTAKKIPPIWIKNTLYKESGGPSKQIFHSNRMSFSRPTLVLRVSFFLSLLSFIFLLLLSNYFLRIFIVDDFT